jgi:hypothetical protein
MSKMNAVVQSQNETSTALAPAIKDEIDGFRRAAAEGQQASLAGTLLRFIKGRWVHKGENGKEELPIGTGLVLVTGECRRGWTKWHNGKPVAHHVGRVCENYTPPSREEIGNTDESRWPIGLSGKKQDPWQFTFYVPLVSDDGDLFTFVTSTAGGRMEVSNLFARYAADAHKHPGQAPVVTLGTDTFESKSYGEVDQPRLDIVDWTDRPEIMLQGPTSQPQPEHEPTKHEMDDEIPSDGLH